MKEKIAPDKSKLRGGTTEDLLIIWDRSSQTPTAHSGSSEGDKRGNVPGKEKICCLWFTGFIANRSNLIRELNLPKDVSNSNLLVYLYQQYGNRAAQYLYGQFAWVLWESKRKILMAVSDRMGNHGIYYTLTGDTVILSNRVEPLLDRLPGPVTMNLRSVVGMLHGEAPLAGETFYEDIHAVEWGGLLTITPENIDTMLYWKLERQPLLRLSSDAEYAEALKELLFRVAAQYTPSCPIGIMMSSGMDSNSVAASLRMAVPSADITAFTLITPEVPDSDESQYSTAVSRHLHIPTVNIRADLYWPLSSAEGIKTPKSDPYYNFFAEIWEKTYREVNRRKINVLFTGSGGDNLFGGGITAYSDLLLSGRWVQLARQLHTHHIDTKMTFLKMIRRMILAPIIKAYVPGWREYKPTVPWLARHYHDLYREYFGRAETSWRMLPGRTQRLTRLCLTNLRLGMAQIGIEGEEHGIQFRHLLLDHRLMEFAASLPTTQTFRPGKSKFILRNAMKGYLPDEVLNLRNKITPHALAHLGYGVREQDKVWPLLTHMRAAEMGFVDESKVQEAYKSYLDDSKQRKFIYAAVVEDWLRRYF